METLHNTNRVVTNNWPTVTGEDMHPAPLCVTWNLNHIVPTAAEQNSSYNIAHSLFYIIQLVKQVIIIIYNFARLISNVSYCQCIKCVIVCVAFAILFTCLCLATGSDRQYVLKSFVRPSGLRQHLCHMSRSLYSVQVFPMNLPQIFIMRVCIAEKVSEVIGQRSRSQEVKCIVRQRDTRRLKAVRPLSVRRRHYRWTVWRRGSLVCFSLCFSFNCFWFHVMWSLSRLPPVFGCMLNACI